MVVNGLPREVSPDTTLQDLLELLELASDGVAVAVDRTVIPRGEHATHTLHEGCQVEILRAVGGG